MDYPRCSGAAPSHHSLGLILAPRVRFRFIPVDYVSSVGQSLGRLFLHTLFLSTLPIVFVINNIISTLQTRKSNEEKKTPVFLIEDPLPPPPLLCISPSYSFCQVLVLSFGVDEVAVML